MQTYIIAIIKRDGSIKPLNVGRMYGPIAARMRADELNRTMQAECAACGGESFVAINTRAI